MVSYEFVSVESMTLRREKREYKLSLVQQPKHSRMCGFGEKVDRRPVDPPPVVKLEVKESSDEPFLCNPYYFMYATLMSATSDLELHMLRDAKTRSTTGSSVSSLYRLKDNFNMSGFFFVFPDLSIRMEGTYRLKFSLFEIINTDIYFCDSICSDPFDVFTAKKFPGMEESTPLSRIFAEQGLKIRIRKDSRVKRYKNEEFSAPKRHREDSDGSNSDGSEDVPSDKGSLSKRSRKSLGGKDAHINTYGDPPTAGIPHGMQMNAPPVNYGYYGPDLYAQHMRPPYPPYGYPRPYYSRDKSPQVQVRRDGASPMDNIPRYPLHNYPMPYSVAPRYPFDAYSHRQFDPMLPRTYPGQNVQGYVVGTRKNSNGSEGLSNSDVNSSLKMESDSSNIVPGPNTQVKSGTAQLPENPDVLSSLIPDQNALRSFYEPSSMNTKNTSNIPGGVPEYGNSYLYYYPPGVAYGYPPFESPYGKRPHHPPPQYAYPISMNHGAPIMMSSAPLPVGYYGPQPPVPYAPTNTPQVMGSSPVVNESTMPYPPNIGYSPQPAHHSTGNHYPPVGIYPPGAHSHNYHSTNHLHTNRHYVPAGVGVAPRSNLQNVEESRHNAVIQGSSSVRNVSPHKSSASAMEPPISMLSHPDSNVPQNDKSFQRVQYPPFVAGHNSGINLPPLNISSQGNGTPIKYEGSAPNSPA